MATKYHCFVYVRLSKINKKKMREGQEEDEEEEEEIIGRAGS